MQEGYTEMLPAERAPRRAGVIMHPTSLPGPYGIGDMGKEAFAFIDWLVDAKMQVWQVLPLVPYKLQSQLTSSKPENMFFVPTTSGSKEYSHTYTFL